MISSYASLFMYGCITSIYLWVSSFILSIFIGSMLGMMLVVSSNKWITYAIESYSFIARGIPALIHLVLIYFVIPSCFNISLSASSAAIIALGICSSGYVVEIIRAGITAIAKEQWEAAYVLGYSTSQCLKRIIMPQAIKIIIPPLIGEYEQLLKSTALASTIGVTEITRTGMNIVARELNPLAIYGTIAILYLSISSIIIIARKYLEERLRYD